MGLVVPLGSAELHEAQGPCAAAAVGGQGRQAQQLEMLGSHLGPGQGGGLRGLGRFRGGVSHLGVSEFILDTGLSAAIPGT